MHWSYLIEIWLYLILPFFNKMLDGLIMDLKLQKRKKRETGRKISVSQVCSSCDFYINPIYPLHFQLSHLKGRNKSHSYFKALLDVSNWMMYLTVLKYDVTWQINEKYHQKMKQYRFLRCVFYSGIIGNKYFGFLLNYVTASSNHLR